MHSLRRVKPSARRRIQRKPSSLRILLPPLFVIIIFFVIRFSLVSARHSINIDQPWYYPVLSGQMESASNPTYPVYPEHEEGTLPPYVILETAMLSNSHFLRLMQERELPEPYSYFLTFTDGAIGATFRGYVYKTHAREVDLPNGEREIIVFFSGRLELVE